MTVLSASDDDVKGSEFTLEFEPGEPTASRLVETVSGFDHNAFVATGTGCGVSAVEVICGLHETGWRKMEALDAVLCLRVCERI